MNNKGQVLIIFVIVLPIFLILFTLIIDLGFLYMEKRNINNNVSDALEYYLNNLDKPNIDDKTKKLLNKNIKDIDEINIVNTDNYVEISLLKTYKGLYSIIPNSTKISITYIGDKESNKIIKG